MAKSALLKSSLAKKYWMALTGLFLCLFLAGHLAGNLQLIFGDALQFNQYALFMTTNPAVKLLSYVTYISIVFHAIDGILLTIQNKKARPIAYAKTNPSANSSFASRNMAILGSLILIFIITHMVNFWAVMHFDKNMPLQTISVDTGSGMKQEFYLTTDNGKFFPANADQLEQAGLEIRNRTEFYNKQANVKMGEGYKDLHKITFAYFQDAKYGLIATIMYVIAMIVLAFHLLHGFASAWQSLGVNHPKYNGFIRGFGKGFAILVPLLFATIPVYIHFFAK
ncbi:succinate dehydrogenase cytochrome b subunit [Flavobacterium sp.]|jgi:succinate dehydrogenase / fumarate reductase cytochrome b subunit|uniref:succinate dehydrogenase cytochrome b subunit n=1 Tax=Flavobacterium sp. TaxID=239 RepID=UPI0037BEBEDE